MNQKMPVSKEGERPHKHLTGRKKGNRHLEENGKGSDIPTKGLSSESPRGKYEKFATKDWTKRVVL